MFVRSCGTNSSGDAACVVAHAFTERAERGTVAVNRGRAFREEGFPDDAVRVRDPALLALRVAAGRAPFLEHRSIGRTQAAVDVAQFLEVLGLDTQMLDARVCVLPS